ncbi:MAG: ATP-dependent metallopeptidase FtsH/Yme1/Tma family protein, partial [Candidatus Woesearchaeota archaeon]
MKKKIKGKKFILLAIILVVSVIIYEIKTQDVKPQEKKYTEFKEMVVDGNVSSVSIADKPKINFVDKKGNEYKTDNPLTDNFREWLLENDVEIKNIKADSNLFLTMFIEMIPYIIFLGIILFIVSKTTGGISKSKNGLFSSGLDVNKAQSSIKFNDVAGHNETKEALITMVDFLQNPKPYIDAGAEIPKGVILTGPPGTGKTLLAKAVAGEAGVPFFSMSGSQFVQMYAGVGASRVRDLFKNAKTNSPCLIFIDEIDAIGTHRNGSGGSGSDSERNQTLNELLTQMDGFESNEGIIVIAATNRADTLDEALIRPGRFDKQLTIGNPDKQARKELLKLYSGNKKFGDDVDFDELATITCGFSGAGIKTLLNEATILSVQNKRHFITKDDIDNAHTTAIVKGYTKKDNTNLSLEEKILTAYHEAGHALINKLLQNNSVSKVTIIPTTSGFGGYTLSVPDENNFRTKEDLLNEVIGLYGGYCAEELQSGNKNKVSGGASRDIEMATKIIKNMVARYGMGENGLLNLNIIN